MTSASNHPTSAVSDSWKKKFALMDQIKNLPESEGNKLPMMTRLSVNYNLLAFLLGPFYYLIKGMWKRAITLTAIAFVVVIFFCDDSCRDGQKRTLHVHDWPRHFYGQGQRRLLQEDGSGKQRLVVNCPVPIK